MGVKQRYREGQPDGPGDALLEAVSDGVIVVDAEGLIAGVNKAFAAIGGWERATLTGSSLSELLPAVVLDPPPSVAGPIPTTTRTAQGADIAVEATVLGPAADGATTLIVRELSTGREPGDRISGERDPLTGLLSRRRFELDAARELRRAERYGGGAMLVLGLDNFSQLNDELGHSCGDALLREAGELITERIREIDLCGRLGGDQFGLLLAELSPEGARQVGEDLVTILHRHSFRLATRDVRVRVSVGALSLESGPRDVSEAMSWTELAMRRAKAMGGGRLVSFEDGLRADSDSTKSWSERIRAALDSDAFVPHFQPILDLSTDTVAIWELLIRMRGERGELIPPNDFLPTAERYGLIHELDRWVVRNAMAAIRAHADRAEINLEVNLSGKSIGDPEMLETIHAELAAGDVDPSRIIFEVTETAAIGNIEEASAFGRQLLDWGCGFALDDFGTGFASFLYLKRLPLTHLKIDGDFISGVTSSAVDQLVVRSIVDIAHGMGLKTIAEYVEDRPTIELLRELEVDYCQGFEVGRPSPPVPPDRLPAR